MIRPSFRLIVTLLCALTVPAALHAQLPTNNNAWHARCDLLRSSAQSIENGTIPRTLVAATRGVTSRQFYVLAVNRSEADQHYVACTMYYLGAISARIGNGGKADPSTAGDYLTLADAEAKDASGQSLTMAERFKRLEVKASGLSGKTLTLTPDETSAALDASTTMPLSLTPGR